MGVLEASPIVHWEMACRVNALLCGGDLFEDWRRLGFGDKDTGSTLRVVVGEGGNQDFMNSGLDGHALEYGSGATVAPTMADLTLKDQDQDVFGGPMTKNGVSPTAHLGPQDDLMKESMEPSALEHTEEQSAHADCKSSPSGEEWALGGAAWGRGSGEPHIHINTRPTPSSVFHFGPQ
ncbi:hypothetical protein JZ751_013214 [Albula glossodonta]|uniref:Uncharacterized protein n=1 Tax=Albula glossodonta TaxID=121402 RepID=A0A8T2NSC4_9TELE|nr:hypothetical protein JZ751_013214 [Albula glossodonta]